MELLRPVLDRLRDRFAPEQIWLFGSRGESRAGPTSDFDLLLVLPDDTSAESLECAIVWNAIRDFCLPIDVVPCTRSEFEAEKSEIDSLPRAAYTRGKLLYVRRP